MRRIIFAAVPPIQILDVTGPFEVFARCGGYKVELVSTAEDGEVTSSSGLSLRGAQHYSAVRGHVDTLLLPGGHGAEQLLCASDFMRWIGRMSTRVRRIGSICTGTFLLAEAGILDDRRATTHWAWCERLANRYPLTSIDPEPIFVRDGSVYTSAGVTAGIDLALSLVEEDHGRRKARAIARDLVLYLHRSGGQTQFSSFLHHAQTSTPRIERVAAWIPDNLDQDLSVESLARRCAMSPRHFARTRVLAARSLIEDTNSGLKEIAARCGFQNSNAMRRAFLREISVSPAQYQERFGREA
jgi:transcriptional regulator GlxA family with amidase domain